MFGELWNPENPPHPENQLIDFRSLRLPGLISCKTIPSGGTSDFIPEMWHAIWNNEVYDCFVEATTKLPFLAMPDAINAIEKNTFDKWANSFLENYNE